MFMRRNRYLMYGIALLHGMFFYGPISALYRQAHGLTISQITVMEGISLALCIFLEVPWGMAADRIGYKKTFGSCCWIYLVSKIVFWQAQGIGWFLAERIMLSVVTAGISGVDASILYLSSQEGTSQKVFGIYTGMQMAGLLAASCIFAVFVGDDYALSGLLTVFSYGTAALLSCGLVEVKPKAAKREGQKAGKESVGAGLKAALGNKSILFFLIASALLSETHQTITVFLNQLQYEKCGLDSSAMGYIYIAAVLMGTAGRYSPCLTRKAGLKGSLALFCGSAMASCLILGRTEHALPSVFGILLLRMSNTFFVPFQMELQNRQISTSDRATALSAHAMVMDGVAVVTNLAFGFLAERGLPLAFFFGMGICFVSLVLFRMWYEGEGRKL